MFVLSQLSRALEVVVHPYDVVCNAKKQLFELWCGGFVRGNQVVPEIAGRIFAHDGPRRPQRSSIDKRWESEGKSGVGRAPLCEDNSDNDAAVNLHGGELPG